MGLVLGLGGLDLGLGLDNLALLEKLVGQLLLKSPRFKINPSFFPYKGDQRYLGALENSSLITIKQ